MVQAKPRYAVPYRRKREGKTNYHKRLSLLKSGKMRLVIRKSLKNTKAQIVEYVPQGDRVVASAFTAELKKLGWNHATGNIPAAYLIGVLLAARAKEKDIKEAIVDLGLQQNTRGRLMAVVKGCKDAGLAVPVEEAALPADERVMGKHVASYEKVKNRESIEKDIQMIKNKILKGQ